LPGWHIARTDPDSLVYRLVHQLVDECVPLREEQARAYQMNWLTTAPVDEPRTQWTCVYPFDPQDELTVTVTTAADLEIEVRAALSDHDFVRATDPVWKLDTPQGRLVFRNLATVEKELTSVTTSYTVTGEASGLVADANLYWQGQTDDPWQVLSADSSLRDGVTFTLPVTGVISVRYQSQARYADLVSGTVLLERRSSRTVPLPLTVEPLLNLFDGWGSILGIPRLPDEDNVAYKARLLAEAEAPPNSTETGVIRGIASRLGLLSRTYWNGIDELEFSEEEVTAVHLVGVDMFFGVTEQLTPEPRESVTEPVDTYYASYTDWREGWYVYVDGVPAQGVTVSGNVVTLGEETSGVVTAAYTVARYQLERDAEDYILSVQPGQGLPPGNYVVLYSRQVLVHGLGAETVQDALLLTAAGLPNELFLELHRTLASGSTTSLGRAGWETAYWFASPEETPGTTQVALPFDAHLTLGDDE
jgi:hypothetical protein